MYIHICVYTSYVQPSDEIHKVVAQGNKVLKSKVPPVRSSLSIYLANEETERILFRPIKVNAVITKSKLSGKLLG